MNDPSRLDHWTEILHRRALEHPERTAYTFLADGETESATLTYGELAARVATVAARLGELAREGDRVLLLYPPGLDFVVAFLACLASGTVAVPAYPPRSPRQLPRLVGIVRDAEPRLALTTPEVGQKLDAAEVAELRALPWLPTPGGDTGTPALPPAPPLDALAMLQYTSGSTGTPKGVAIRHRNLLHNQRLIQEAFHQGSESVIVGWLPVYHDMGLIGNVLQPLYVGGRCILMAPVAFLKRPMRWLEAVHRYRATTSGGPNFGYDLCVRKSTPEERRRLDLSSWRVAFNGAEPVRAETLERFSAAFAVAGFDDRAFLPCYGLAEGTLLVTGGGAAPRPVVERYAGEALEQHRAVADAAGRPLVGCGAVAGEQRVMVVDPATEGTPARPLPSGEIGEIWVAGPSVAAGYWHRPEATEETFGGRREGTGERYLRTGDLGFLSAAGELFVTGRQKELMIVRGRNIYPQDVERRAEEAVTATAAGDVVRPGCSAAFSVESPVEDGFEERVVLVMEVHPRAAADAHGDRLQAVMEEARRAVAETMEVRLAEVVLTKAGEVEKTTSGKIRRRRCRERWAAGSLKVLARLGESVAASPAAAKAPPTSAVAELLALAGPEERGPILAAALRRIAARVLAVAPSRLHSETPLTTLGLDSLGAVELQSAVEEELGVSLPLDALMAGMTLATAGSLVAEHDPTATERTGPPPLPAVPHTIEGTHGDFPLSFMQRTLWVQHLLDPDSGAWNVPLAIRLPPDTDLAALRRALVTVVHQHAALGATFQQSADSDEPRQCLGAAPLVAEAIEEVAVAAGAAALGEALAKLAQRAFDLGRGPLFRATVLLPAGEAPVLLLTAHHIIIDGSSLWLLLDRLTRALGGAEPGPSGATPTATYADFVHWQRELVAGPWGEAAAAFWKRTLGEDASRVPLPQLPLDRPQWRGRSDAGGHVSVRLEADLVSRLEAVARLAGTTLHGAILAAYLTLLARYGGQRQLVVGAAVAGRRRRELAGLVGCCFNTVPVPGDLEDEPTGEVFLRRLGATLAAVLEYQEYPSHLLAERFATSGERTGATGPGLFETLLIFQQPRLPGSRAPGGVIAGGLIAGASASGGSASKGLALELLAVPQGTARSPLEMEVAHLPSGRIEGWLRYSTDLFDAASVERLGRHLDRLLVALVADPAAPILELSLLDDAERQQLAVWGHTGGDYARRTPGTLDESFLLTAAAHPSRIACVGADGEGWSYRQLAVAMECVARGLDPLPLPAPGVRASGVCGPLVGLMMQPGPALIAAMLGILRAGAGFVPLESTYPKPRLALMVRECGLTRVITERALAPHWEDGEILAADGVLRIEEMLDAQPTAGVDRKARRRAEPESPAYVIYTSGSTGTPKGVPILHRHLMPEMAWGQAAFGLGSETRVLQSLSYGFDFGVWELLTTVLSGGTLCFADPERRGDTVHFLEMMARHRANTLHTTPSFLRALLASIPSGQRLETLELVHLGGEQVTGPLVEAVLAQAAPGVRIYNGYGPTEATVNCTLYHADEPAGMAAVPIGRATTNHRLVVATVHRGAPRLLGGGEPGELLIGGPGLTSGYLGRRRLTAEKFLPDPWSDTVGGRLYRTGDLVRYRGNGQLEFLGRIDGQVKVRGFRIELGEIEAALVALPPIREAVVTLHGKAEDPRLVAYFTRSDGEDLEAGGEVPLSAAALRRSLKERLPAYMIPAAFLALDVLPRTASGKLDRRALPSPTFEEGGRDDGEFVAPRTAVEERVAALCAEVLGLARISVEDDLFELGCHSLLATQIVARAREAFAVEVPLKALFEEPTVAALARRVEAARFADGATNREGEGEGEGDERVMTLPPIEPGQRTDPIPLSYAQERLWFIAQLDPEAASYNIPRALHMVGRLHIPWVEGAYSEIVRRHEILRTAFPAEGGRPVQRVGEPWPLRVAVVDLSGLEPQPRQTLTESLIVAAGQRPFDLAAGSLLRAMALRRGPEDHVMVQTEHHLVHDGWTQAVLVREFLTLYTTLSQGGEVAAAGLPTLPVQYADFACWQRRWLHETALARQLEYWQARLAGAPELLALPADRPRPAAQSFRGVQIEFELPAAVGDALRELGRRRGTTLFMTLLAVFETLLWRYTGRTDLVLGTGIANRQVQEVEALIGMVINTVVLRTDLAGNPSFEDLLRRVRRVCLEAYAHQDLPLDLLVDALKVRRSLSHTPIFQTMFAFMDAPMPELRLPGLELSVLEAHNRSSKCDLTVVVIPHAEQRAGRSGGSDTGGGEVTVHWEYSSDLFDRPTMERMIGHFRQLLAGAAAAPEKRLSRLPLLTPVERQELVEGWGRSVNPVPTSQPMPLAERIAAWAMRQPETPAVVGADGEVLSYGELHRRAGILAARLRPLGAAPERPVALLLPRSPALVTAAVAALYAGAPYLPIDPAYPAERRRFLVQDSTAAVVVTAVIAEVEAPTVAGTAVVSLDATPWHGATMPPVEAPPEALAYVIYTSGSTGIPKGVGVSRAALENLVGWHQRRYGVTADDRATLVAGPAFDASVWEIWPYLTAGAVLHVVPEAVRTDPAALPSWLAEQGITLTFLPTPLAEASLSVPWPDHGPRALLTGGDRLHRRGRGLPCRLVNHYGPTENAVVATAGTVHPEAEGGAEAEPTEAPLIGSPIDGVTARVLDPALGLVPAGVPGELFLGGASLARGYRGRPGLTAERFIPDPFSTAESGGGRLYRTGDRVRWRPRTDGGALEFLGRTDHQVQLRGLRIELGEIEAVLAAHPGVNEAVVLAVGDGEAKRLVACLVPAESAASAASAALDQAALRTALLERLPEPVVPAAFVFLERLPQTANGKVDRGALEAAAGGAAPAERPPYQPPRTATEERLAAIWREVLLLEAETPVGIHDDFFQLGGHSLRATQAVSRVREVFGVDLAVRALFETPTLAALARRVASVPGRSITAAIEPLSVAAREAGPLPLSFAQERLWFLDQLEPGSPLYNLPGAFRLHGTLPAGAVAALAVSVETLVERHEVLRSRYPAQGGAAKVVVESAAPLPLPVLDLTSLEPETRQRELQRLARREAAQPFDLARGPLLRTGLLRLGPTDHVLLMNLHHMVGDGWSMGVLLRELAAVYRSHLAGEKAALAPLPVQYTDFAAWQRRHVSGEILAAQLDFWRRTLEGFPPVIELPTDRPRPAVQSFRGGRLRFQLPAACTQGGGSGATPFMVLLAAFQGLLVRLTGQRRVVVGTPIAGRHRREIEGLVGCFVNTLVLPLDATGDPSFAELLEQVREGALAAYGHQDLPFEKLVEELAPRRDLSRNPLFQVFFQLMNAAAAVPSAPNLLLEPLELDSGTAKFELHLCLIEEPDGALGGYLEYNRDLFDPATAERLLGWYRRLLTGATDRSRGGAVRLSALPLLSAAERHQLLDEWGREAHTPPPVGETLVGLVAAQVARTPDAVALEAVDATLTYRALDAAAEHLAGELRRRGVGPEVRVALFLDRRASLVVALLAVLKAGGAYVPLDPAYPAERLAVTLADAAVAMVLTHQPLLPALPTVPQLPPERVLCVEALEQREAAAEPPQPSAAVSQPDPANLAYVLFTSGSTGRPKGVAMTHGGAARMVRWGLEAFSPQERAGVLLATSVCFDLSIFELFLPLAGGGTVVLAADALELVSRPPTVSVTLINTVPSAMVELLRLGAVPPSVRTINLAGEPLSRSLVEAIYRETGARRVWNLYGPTEDTTYSTGTIVTPSPLGEAGPPPTIGGPVAGSRARVLDDTRGLAPTGAIGELVLTGPGLARGYLGRPALTAARFLPDPLAEAPGGRLYATGDRARFQGDGSLEYLGRRDHQVKLRGFRIELGEIETALRAHGVVEEAVAVVHEGTTLVAYFTTPEDGLQGDGDAVPERLRSHLRDRLPGFMVPALFVALDALPRTPNGKVDRGALPHPDPRHGGASARRVAPRNPLEEELAGIWNEVLQGADVGVTDDFFALGGHSLLATRVLARVREKCGVNVPLRALFEEPTVARLAVVVESERQRRQAAPPASDGGSDGGGGNGSDGGGIRRISRRGRSLQQARRELEQAGRESTEAPS